MAETPGLVVRIAANLDELKRNLREGSSQIEVTTAGMTRLANSFSGEKLIQNAHNVVAAIGGIENAQKLTAAEQARVNATLDRALEKYQALGREAPPQMVALHRATTPIPAANSSILSSLSPLAAAFGVAFSVGAVVSFGRELLQDADALVKLSEKTGISIEAMQRLKYIAEQSGNTFEQVASAVSMLQRRLAGDDKSAVAALQELGISITTFKALSPDEQFLAIAVEVAKIEDPMRRAKVATDLFGRAGADLLPTLIAKVRELGEAAPVMSERAVKAFDDVGDALNRTWTATRNLAGDGIGRVIDAFRLLGTSASALATGDLARAWRAINDLELELPKVVPPMTAIDQPTKNVALSMGELDRISKELTVSTQAQIVKSEAFKRAQDALFGRDVIQRALDYAEQLGNVGNITMLTKDKKEELKRAVERALEVYKALGEQAPPALLALAEATKPPTLSMIELEKEVRKLHEFALPALTGLLGNLERTITPLSVSTMGLATSNETLRTNLRFTAETIESATGPAIGHLTDQMEEAEAAAISWSEAMDLVRQGLGTMTGTITAPVDTEAVRAEILRAWTEGRYYGPVVGGTRDNPRGTGPDWDRLFPHRVEGGPVSANQPYVVGERGPELFVPQSNGAIAANGAFGGTSINISIHCGSVLGNKHEIADVVGDAMLSRLRSLGVRVPSGA